MIDHNVLRLTVFILILLALMLWEYLSPKRIPACKRKSRWPSNITLSFLNSVLLKFLIPSGMISVAFWAGNQHYGLFTQTALPVWMIFIVGLIALDFIIYWQHVIFHKVPWLWRLHRVHHSDIEFDVTTAIRFHPLEILLSSLIKMAAIFALGITPLTIFCFEIILNSCAMFNHSNIAIPSEIDAWLRLFLVTPDMHRVHHSVDKTETNRNFGFNFPWWDKLFGTYQTQPKNGHTDMLIGLQEYRVNFTLDKILFFPFKK